MRATMEPSAARLPLNSLRFLQAVARHGSMARAAQALHVEPSAVSMQIKALADYLGAPVVVRSGRGVELTALARQLLPPVAEGLAQIERSLQRARQAAREQPFVISLLPSFLLLALVPHLERIEQAGGMRRVMLSPSKALADVGDASVHAAIRLGAGAWPGLRARKLADEFLVPVCIPDLRRRVGVLAPGELPRGVPRLSSRRDTWDLWCPGAGAGSGVLVDDAVAVVMQAEAGRGVALTRLALVGPALRAGRLVEAGPRLPYQAAYYWVTPQDTQDDGLEDRLFAVLREIFD